MSWWGTSGRRVFARLDLRLNSVGASPFVYLILQGALLLFVMGLDNLRPRQRRAIPAAAPAPQESVEQLTV